MKRLYLIPMVYLEEHSHLAPKYLVYHGGWQAAHPGLESATWSRAVYREPGINLVMVDATAEQHAILEALPDVVVIPGMGVTVAQEHLAKLDTITTKVKGRKTRAKTYRDYMGNLDVPPEISGTRII